MLVGVGSPPSTGAPVSCNRNTDHAARLHASNHGPQAPETGEKLP